MTDSKINTMVYIKRLLAENEIPFGCCPSGALDVHPENETILITDHEGDGEYWLGFYNLMPYINHEGEEDGITCEDEPYMSIKFDRPDSCVGFIKNYLNQPYTYLYPLLENLEEWESETDEQHKLWLLKQNPDYVKKYHNDWLQYKLIKHLAEESE